MKPLNRLTLYVLIFAIAFAAMVPVADAGCRQFVRSYHHVKAVAVVQPLVIYKAGADIEAEALAEKVARLVTQKLVAAQTLQQTAPASTSAVLSQKCASCHNDTKAFSFAGGLSDNNKVRWMEMLAFDKDVPPAMKPLMSQIKADGSGADVTDAVMQMPAARTEPEAGVLE